MRSFLVISTLVFLVAAAAAHADPKSLPPIVSVKDVTVDTILGMPSVTWHANRTSVAPTVTVTFTEATPIDDVKIFDSDGPVSVAADDKNILTTPAKHYESVVAHIGGPVRVLVFKTTSLKRIELSHGGQPLAPIIAGPDAVAALPGAIHAISDALDKCDAAAIGASVDFPFTYKNAQHESSYAYKTADLLVKACADWRKKAANVDMDMVSSPVPEGVFIRFSDIDVRSEGPGRISLGVSHVRRAQYWRLAWRENAWHLVTIDY